MEQNKEEYSVIKYVSDSEESRLMLFLLSESINGLEFDELNKENQISETVIRKLVDFELVETDKSVAHGRTMTYVVRTSRYYLTDYGENFYNLLTALSEVREKTVIPQLTVGEFTRFKEELDKFINSENSDEVISSYEFIFGTEIDNGNFYKRCKKKLKYLLKAIIDLRRAILSIASDKAHKKTINEFSLKVTEFADIAGEISSVLRKEGNDIKKALDKLGRYKGTSFYEERAKKITGIRFDESSADTLEKRVLKFVSEINVRGVYSAFSGRIKDIIDEARSTKKQLEKLKNQIEDKEAIRALASKISKLDEEDAKQLFLKIVSNRKIHHLSENEHSTFSSGILEVKMPEVKQREKNKRKEDLEINEDLELIRLKSELEDAKNYYNELNMFKKISSYKNGEVIENINKPLVLDDLEAQDKLISSMSERIKNIVKNTTEQVDTKEVEYIIYEELDPIKWFDFYLRYTKDAIVTPEILSQSVINSVSNGERARIFYINVIAMLKTLLPQIKKSAPIIVAMDEAFATVDPTQTKFIIHSLHDISDLLMMTVPNVNKLPITLNTTKANFVRIRKQESSNGNSITFTSPVPMYEEIIDE